MANKDKFTPLAGNTYVVKFKFDKPLEGEGQYGKYWSYGIDVWETVAAWKAGQAPKEMVWFANGRIHALLMATGVGQKSEASVSVSEAIGKEGKTYKVFRIKFGGKEYCSDDYSAPKETAIPKSSGKYIFGELVDLMIACYGSAKIVTGQPSGEDTRAICNSLFIACERNGIKMGQAAQDAPAPSDNDFKPDPEDEELPF